MKILFVCHRFPYPPNEGGKIRSFNMIAHLQQQHEVTVASLVESKIDQNDIEGIKPYCHSYIAQRMSKPIAWLKALFCLLTLIPSSMGYFHSWALGKKIKTLLNEQQYDLIVVHCSSVAHFILSEKDTPKVLDFCDMDSQKWLIYAKHKPFPLSLAYWLEGIKLQRAEKKLAMQFDGSSVATAFELETLESFESGRASFCFPNGVDTEYFSPVDRDYDANTICFIGKMNYYPNEKCMLEFCQQVFPLLRERYSNLKLSIVGSNPTDKILALADIDGIEVTGRVADVRPYVQQAALTVVPLEIARGTQNKILESMAMGVPVVCSNIAARGIDALPGKHVLVAKNSNEYVLQISRILDSAEERIRLSQAGRSRMLSHHGWDIAMEKMDANLLDQQIADIDVANTRIQENHI
ncbi:MAG: TIGR03087 family PEP-CTERM/XrtA system glycosyltransferase [Gammaproteobacteria bacterium]|nr:TIGR03087 family PEP-CTERM/XrtA system glycosyltransferase [Gammaproteobacteria bacterium]